MRKIIAITLGGILAASAIAFAAQNVVPSSRAGDGAGTISGYTVSNVAYTVDNTNPQNLAKVEFDLDADATTVKVRLQSSGGNWYACAEDPDVDNHWSCTTTGQQIEPMDELRVVAVQ